MMPALFQRTSKRSSRARKSFAEALMVERSARSSLRTSRRPLDVGWAFWRVEMAAVHFSDERPAR